jgi:hypothetical protein
MAGRIAPGSGDCCATTTPVCFPGSNTAWGRMQRECSGATGSKTRRNLNQQVATSCIGRSLEGALSARCTTRVLQGGN